jgi:hypothetical protein
MAVLNFLGIQWSGVTVGQINGAGAFPANVANTKFCTLISAPCMAEAIRFIEDPNDALPHWITQAGSVYVYGFQETDPCRKLLRLLTSDAQANIRSLNTTHCSMSITSDFPELCGPMSGMRVPVDLSGDDLVYDFSHQRDHFQSIITTRDATVFFRVTWGGTPFYLNMCRRIVDLSSTSATFFDVKKLFCEAVPTAMYLKWAFRDSCWTGPETSGCLIVDDPVLKPRYGFLHFRETLDLMGKYNFTTTIAFIPWNWRRTNPRTVVAFQRRPDRFSLAVHGCDHTASEFATRSTAVLNRRIKAANQRMESLCQRTSLQFDRVMVFPQGAFSPETGFALKLNGFIAAVNTEVAPANNARNETTIADLWNVAIMKYGTFPIFTRRYLSHGIENFAFDALLGKPCLIAAHHDVFKGHGSDLVAFIARLNSLNWNLRWRSLGEAMSHSFKVRNEANGTVDIQMFAKSLVMENRSMEPQEAVLMKEEGNLDCVKAVVVNQTTIDFGHDGRNLQFRVKLYPREVKEARVVYSDNLDISPVTDGMGYSFKTCIRRYLSEFRDNYVSQSDFLRKSTGTIRRLLK